MIKSTSMFGTTSGLALAMALLTAAPPACAQSAPKSGDNAELETVTVTGYRMKEDIQKVSAAVSSLSGEALETKSVLQIADLQNTTPSLSVTDSGLSQNVNIRGIGLASGNPNVTVGVPIYLDSLVQPPIVGTGSFYDIQDVEVYRGPQGTFAGANSTGGAVFVTSNSPTLGKFGGNIEAWGGDYWDVGARGAVNVPLTDTMAFRAAFNLETRDSFDKLVSTPQTPTGVAFNAPGSLDEKDLRLGFYWEPIENLSILLKAAGSQKSTDGYAARPIPGTANAAYVSDDVRDLSYDAPEMNKDRATREMLEVKYILPNGITLRSVTGYQENVVKDVYDLDATANSAVAVSETQDVSEKPFTQEINIISPDSGKIKWVLGGFYWYDITKVGVALTSYTSIFHTYMNLGTDKKSEAVFGRALYNITDALQFEIGGRYTHDEVSSNGYIHIAASLTSSPVAVIPMEGSWRGDNWTGKVGLSYTLDQNNYLYAFVAKGAKMGGSNGGVLFKPETVWDYEAGWKTNLLDNKLVLQLSGFYNQFKNFQYDAVLVANGTVGPINIPDATIDGIEAQVFGYFGPLKFDASLAWTESSIGATKIIDGKSLPDGGAGSLGAQCAAGQTANCFDYTSYYISVSGKRNPYAPTWTTNFGVEYAMNLAADYTLTPRVDYSLQGSQWTSLLEYRPQNYIASHDLWNLRLTLDHDQWSLAAYITNLMDKTYISGQFSSTAFYGPPRQYGARLSYRF